jgi:hypothetical protein
MSDTPKQVAPNRVEKFIDYRGIRFRVVRDSPYVTKEKPREWFYVFLWPGVNTVIQPDTTFFEVQSRMYAIGEDLPRGPFEHVHKTATYHCDENGEGESWRSPSVTWELGHDFQHLWDEEMVTGYGEEYLVGIAMRSIDVLIGAGICYDPTFKTQGRTP